MKNINIGPYEIMKPERKFDYKSDLLNYVEKLGDGWNLSEYSLNKYIQTELNNFNVARTIINKYSITCITQVKIGKIKQVGEGLVKVIKYRSATPLDAKKFILGYDANFVSVAMEELVIQANIEDKDLDDEYGQENPAMFYIVR
jgi:hypothetical protein